MTPEGVVIPGDAETFEDTFPGLRRLRFTPPTTGDPPPRPPATSSPQASPRPRTRAANKHARRRAERRRNRQRRLTREAQRLLIVDDVGPPPF
ncbi:hypothetical protein [Gordonia aichiensis]|uniref:hypothetical protein n=1 Tax=Gordonia aichiensis TaxID=36820 RepID=UPI000348B882|nr:hypothetical protein [Gordonia aichiensis]